MKNILLSGVEKRFPAVGAEAKKKKSATHTVLARVDLEIAPGELFCLLGPSGCGKSTLLALVAGFEKASAGRVTVGGREVTGPSPERIVIFQDYALFPWRSALGNVLFALEARGVRGTAARERALELLRIVGLQEAAARLPHQLSGGQRQRVAIARALAAEPEVLLMDEPFGALDAFTRMRLQDELLRLRERTNMTVLFVTHDIEEAVYLGDRIALMSSNPGRILRVLDGGLSRPADRTGPDFLARRREVLEAFSFAHAPNSATAGIVRAPDPDPQPADGREAARVPGEDHVLVPV